MQTGLMSELDAVNKILAVAGDSPVQTLEDEYVQAKLARQLLTRASRDIQSMAWWFNEEQQVKLIPDIAGNITLPVNLISCIPNNDAGEIVQRGNRLYDRANRTYLFTAPVSVDITLLLEWSELPQAARAHIVDVACTQYNNDFFGSEEIKRHLEKNEGKSYVVLKANDTDARDVNLLNNERAYSIAFRNRRRG